MRKKKLLSFGAYPTVSLADARRTRDAAKRVLAPGEDPGLKVKLTKIAKRAGGDETFGKIAEDLRLESSADRGEGDLASGDSYPVFGPTTDPRDYRS